MGIAHRTIRVISRTLVGLIVLSWVMAGPLTKPTGDSVASAAGPSGSILQVRGFSEPTATPDSRHLGPFTVAATATRSLSLGDIESIPRLATPTPTSGLRELEPIFRSATSSPTPGSRDLEPIFRLATPGATPGLRDLDPTLRLPTATPGGRGTTPLLSPGAPPPVGMPASSEPARGLPSHHLGIDAAMSLFGPALAIHGQRAIFRWGPAPDAVLTVDYGPTQALGWRAVGEPIEVGSAIVQRAVLDGLQTGRSYYYRATLADGLRVLGEVPITPFETPHVAVRVRPLRIDVIKDGDTDTVFGKNYGEGRYSWDMRLDPRSEIWPPADIFGGCFPVGGSVSVEAPGQFTIPYNFATGGFGGASDPPTLNEGNTSSSDPPNPTNPVGGCAEDFSAPGIDYQANTAKVKSGETIQLPLPAQEWLLPDGAGNSSAAGPPPAAMAPLPPTTAGEEPGAGPSTGGPQGGSGGSSGPAACENRQPHGAFVPVYLTARGTEVDRIQQGNFPGAGTTVRYQRARDTEVVCFDLQLSDETVERGVDASEGNWAFRIWFEVSLVYRP